MVEGPDLKYILKYKQVEDKFANLIEKTEAVVCCRVTPS